MELQPEDAGRALRVSHLALGHGTIRDEQGQGGCRGDQLVQNAFGGAVAEVDIDDAD